TTNRNARICQVGLGAQAQGVLGGMCGTVQVIKIKLAEISYCGLRNSIEGEVKDLLKMFDLAYKFETENDEQTRISIIVNAIKNMIERDPVMMKTMVENQEGDVAKNVVENQEGDAVRIN
nr:peptidase C48, SUMO/sentrin/Ubl1 [Tanacetum cinerariifolium]